MTTVINESKNTFKNIASIIKGFQTLIFVVNIQKVLDQRKKWFAGCIILKDKRAIFVQIWLTTVVVFAWFNVNYRNISLLRL